MWPGTFDGPIPARAPWPAGWPPAGVPAAFSGIGAGTVLGTNPGTDPGTAPGTNPAAWLLAGLLAGDGPPAWARVAGVVLVALAVKLMDDVLDRDDDAAAGRPNWAERIGPGATAYALAALAGAAALSIRDALSLFWASYVWGMAHGASPRLPLGLAAWQESALALAASVVATGLVDTLGALALVGSIQLLDDWWDLRRDPPGDAGLAGAAAPGSVPRNWAGRLGRTEALLIGCGLGLAAVARDPVQALSAWAVAVMVGTGGGRGRGRGSRQSGGGPGSRSGPRLRGAGSRGPGPGDRGATAS